MLKRTVGQAWICSGCLRQSHQRQSQRQLATAAAGLVKRFIPAHKGTSNGDSDDKLLRDIFDSRSAWQDFASRTQTLNKGRSAGLFRNAFLTTPGGFQKYASHTLARCQRLVARISTYDTIEQYKGIVKDLDRLSDLLCRVIDLCEFVRSSHPDPVIQEAATKAYLIMYQYMNVLNTTPALDKQLRKALSTPEVAATWTEQEKTVAGILTKDFSKSAIDLPDNFRKAFVDMSDAANQMGSQYMDNMDAEQHTLVFSSSRLHGMDPVIVRQHTRWGTTTIPSVGNVATLALRSVEDADIRREIYIASRSAARSTVHDLEQLLETRAKLADLSGFKSFSHLTLTDKMAKTPAAVNKFLNALYAENRPKVQSELNDLMRMKTKRNGEQSGQTVINAWDRDFYMSKVLSSMEFRSRNDHLSAYFSIGTVMQGLSRLFRRLYGIQFVPRETHPGETWHPDVRRLDVVDESQGTIAVIYCDLFQRADKSPNPAHFTVRCSRRITDEEVIEADQYRDDSSPQFDSLLEAANDGLPVGINQTATGASEPYQLPTIALVCDFAYQRASASESHRPALLSFREVQTLFHEMGHAAHSIFGRTELQNVSGTRCATDFAELPSVLMEHFASAPEVLALYARHWETDLPLNPSLVAERLEAEKRMHGAEVEGQILMSLLDQAFHSADGVESGGRIDSTTIYHDVWRRYSSVPEPEGTTWQGFFGHLVGYGATYYAYLFDRVIAAKIWRDVFQRGKRGAIDERAGRRFHDEVLRWGGSRDGWKCIAGVLKDQEGVLAEGKDGAMEIVGRWGLKN